MLSIKKLISDVVLVGGLLACALSCQTPNTVVENASPDPSTIRGVIMDWALGDSMTIMATAIHATTLIHETIASGRVSSDGSFALDLPEPPVAAQVRWPYPHDMVTDTSARFMDMYFLELSGPSRWQTYWAYNASMPTELPGIPGYFDSFPVYADRPASVTGADSILLSPGIGLPNDTILNVRQLDFNRGWNHVVRRTTHPREHVEVVAWRIEDTRTLNWYLQQPGN